jgi:hypothetical protein
MEGIDRDLDETRDLERKVLRMFNGKRDYILMSVLTMVTAEVIGCQKRNVPDLDLEGVFKTADEQLRYAVSGVLDRMEQSKRQN